MSATRPKTSYTLPQLIQLTQQVQGKTTQYTSFLNRPAAYPYNDNCKTQLELIANGFDIFNKLKIFFHTNEPDFEGIAKTLDRWAHSLIFIKNERNLFQDFKPNADSRSYMRHSFITSLKLLSSELDTIINNQEIAIEKKLIEILSSEENLLISATPMEIFTALKYAPKIKQALQNILLKLENTPDDIVRFKYLHASTLDEEKVPPFQIQISEASYPPGYIEPQPNPTPINDLKTKKDKNPLEKKLSESEINTKKVNHLIYDVISTIQLHFPAQYYPAQQHSKQTFMDFIMLLPYISDKIKLICWKQIANSEEKKLADKNKMSFCFFTCAKLQDENAFYTGKIYKIIKKLNLNTISEDTVSELRRDLCKVIDLSSLITVSIDPLIPQNNGLN